MKRVTIGDLADELGLAKSAVSYALNDRPGVSEETRAKVKALAARRGWHPSAAARVLSGGRAGAIGIVLNRPAVLLAEEPWYQLVLAGIEEVLIEADISLTLRMVGRHETKGMDTYRGWARDRRVDGVVVLDGVPDDPRLPLLGELGMPAVLMGFRAAGYSSVTGDRPAEAGMLVDHLSSRGASELLHLSGPAGLISETNRRDAVRTAAASHHLKVTAIESDYTFEGARAAIAQAWDEGCRPDAMICSNDVMAVAALTELSHRGVPVPEMTRIASWDDSYLTRGSRPPLTALDRQPIAYGRVAARLLLDEISNTDEHLDAVQPAELRIRQST